MFWKLCFDQILIMFSPPKFHWAGGAILGYSSHEVLGMLHMLGRQLMCFSVVLDPFRPAPYGHIWGLSLQIKLSKSPVTKWRARGGLTSGMTRVELRAYTLGKWVSEIFVSSFNQKLAEPAYEVIIINTVEGGVYINNPIYCIIFIFCLATGVCL